VIRALQLGMHWFPERAGGLDRVYYELSRALPGAGVSFAGLVAGSGLAAAESHGAVQAFAPATAPLRHRFAALRRCFAEAMSTHDPDLIVSHFALYTVPVLDRLRHPLVIHFQGPWADEGVLEGNAGLRRALKWGVERLVYRRAARAIVLSSAFAEVLERSYKVPREKIQIIPGGVDSGRFAITETRAAARARLGWPAERNIVVAVRRLAPRMGLENLITAVAMLRRDVPGILLVVAGRGGLHARLSALIESLDLAGNVRLLGFVSDDDLPYLYRAADLSVVPSVALEGFGLVAAESLAAGTPCLVSPVGGLPEVVAPLSVNLVLRSAAPADIARGLADAFLGRLALPDEMQCRHYAEKNFEWRLIAARVADVYRAALE
jgi:glycosyltransferase involved in cell wall biosynthesis